jgi:teichuronic acid biosynthesis glycosyltransferase TuaC
LIRLVTFTTLYPNAIDPRHGIFVETRLRHLLATGIVQSRVVAPVPWFPSTLEVFGRYARFARVPAHEQREGVAIQHPRYAVLPRIGMSIAPSLLARAGARPLTRLRDEGYDFDAIDAHYFYPDGVAAVMLGRSMGRPVVVTARGSDINLIAQLPGPREAIRRAAKGAAAIIAVATSLKDKLVELGIGADKIHVLRNGVDLNQFRPVDRDVALARMQLPPGRWLASVGNLVPEKGHELAIEALTKLPGVGLLIVGSGAQDRALRRLSERLGLSDRVRIIGAMPQQDLPYVYCASELLVLASSREGWPNVLLEAMACGTPVVATDVGAAREIVGAAVGGAVVSERTSSALANAIRGLLERPPQRVAVRKYAEQFSWDDTTNGQVDLFRSII